MGYPIHRRRRSRPVRSTIPRDRGHRRGPSRASTTGRNRMSRRSTVHLVGHRGDGRGTPPRSYMRGRQPDRGCCDRRTGASPSDPPPALGHPRAPHSQQEKNCPHRRAHQVGHGSRSLCDCRQPQHPRGQPDRRQGKICHDGQPDEPGRRPSCLFWRQRHPRDCFV